MPMQVVALLTSASTAESSFGRGGRGSRNYEILDRLPAAIGLLLVHGEVGTVALDRLLRSLVGHLHRVVAARVRKVSRLSDFYLVGCKGQVQVRIADHGYQRLAPVDVAGGKRFARRAQYCIVSIMAGEGAHVLRRIVLLPLCFLGLDRVRDRVR